DLHEISVTKFTSNWSKDTSATRALVIFYDYSCVLVERNVRTVISSYRTACANDNRFNNVTLLDNATWCCLFNRADNQITDFSDAASRSAQHTNAHKLLRTGIISSSQPCKWLNHPGVPSLLIELLVML